MPLSKEEREQFLAEPHIGSLAVTAGPDRAPLVVPIWYQYTPGGELRVGTEAESRKRQLIEAAGRFSILAERSEPTVRYVSVEGPVTRIEEGTDAQAQEMAERYLGKDSAKRFLEFARENLGKEVVIYMRPERWLSSDMGSF